MQASPDAWDLLRQACRSLFRALLRISGLALVGAAVGLLLGLLGSPLTLGGSLLLGPLGALLGAAIGSFRAVRYYAGLLEVLLLYHPRQIKDMSFTEMTWTVKDVEYTVQSLVYDMDVGPQTSYLLRPSGEVRTLWLFFGGNAMLARDWLAFCDKVLGQMDQAHTAFLLVDYPGYGRNAGDPSPESVLQSSQLALEAALKLVGEPDVHLLGHSLGAAAAAQLAAAVSQPGLLVLSAPFIDIPHMAVQLLSVLLARGLPQVYALLIDVMPFEERVVEKCLPSSSWLANMGHRMKPLLVRSLRPIIPQRWDNRDSVERALQVGWRLRVLHGSSDDLIPSEMGRSLAQLSKEDCFSEISGGGHNDVVLKGFGTYMEIMGLATQ